MNRLGAAKKSTSPRVGDKICVTQAGRAGFTHHYNAAWGSAGSEVVAIASSRFCFNVAERLDANWWRLSVQEFHARMPSFTPRALPGHPTGENHVVLDILPSNGRLYAPTGEVLFEFNLRLTNDIFSDDYPAPVRVGAHGNLNRRAGTLNMSRMRMDAMTPPNYQGPRP